jgi:DhnA family fructose-bisphosphate aldolase class Ia
MDGLKRRVGRLFENGSFVLAAADHGQFSGVPEGAENIIGYIREVESTEVDGIIINPGVASLLQTFDCRKSLVIRASHAGSAMSGDIANTKYFLKPENAMRMGADAVIVMGIVGQQNDSEALFAVSQAVWEYHQYGMVVIAEMLPYRKEDYASTKIIADIARIGAELGADIIKTVATERYETVVCSCPVPIIIAGGEKNKDFITVVKEAALAGAVGAAIGRNLFQEKNKNHFIRSVKNCFGGGKC